MRHYTNLNTTLWNPLHSPLWNPTNGSSLSGSGQFTPSSLSPAAWYKPSDAATAFEESTLTTPATVGDPLGGLLDKSGNSRTATQSTSSYRPTLVAGPAIRSDFSNDVLSATNAITDGECWINTPFGHYKSEIHGGATLYLPLCDSTEIVNVSGALTAPQIAALTAYFGTTKRFAVWTTNDSTITLTATGGSGRDFLCVGANGATYTISNPSGGTTDLIAQGLTSPFAICPIDAFSTNTALTSFACSSNQLTGSIPSLSANTALAAFYCFSNQLTGSIPSLSSNTALAYFYCFSNQLTGSIPSLSSNTALSIFQCQSNQLTGSIPSLSANTALAAFFCYSNQLTGSIPSLSANTALEAFYCQSNQLTGFSGGTVSITLGDFNAQNNLLTQAAVDAILAAFVAANKTTGTRTLNLGGTGNAAPSATGLTDKATLVSRGWTVTTN